MLTVITDFVTLKPALANVDRNHRFCDFKAGYESRDKEIEQLNEKIEDLLNNVSILSDSISSIYRTCLNHNGTANDINLSLRLVSNIDKLALKSGEEE